MTKNVIFFVHGVGRHEQGWSRLKGGPIHALLEASKKYDCLNGLDLEDLVDLVEIRYDDIFDQHLKQWAELADELKGASTNSSSFDKVQNLLSSLDDDENKFAQYGGDVILYTAFDLIARRVRLRVNSIISNKITASLGPAREEPGPNPEFSIVGHSLGTTIVHDCLHQLASNDWLPKDDLDIKGVEMTEEQRLHLNTLMQNPDNNPFAPPNFVWDNVMMVSNTSRLLHQATSTPYKSLVQPDKSVRYFFNIDHELDPISKVKKFEIPGSWNQSRAFHLEVDHIHEANVHGFAHYLKRPSVHRLLFRTMVPQFTSSGNDQARAFERDFPKYKGEFDVEGKLKQETKLLAEKKRKGIRGKLNKLKQDFQSESLGKFLELIKQFSDSIGAFR